MSDPTNRLPERPSLEQLRKQAKELLRAFRQGSEDAISRVRAVLSEISNEPSLTNAQYVIARELGFESWAKLARHIEATHPEGLAKYERLADEIARAYSAGDSMAIRQINWTHGTSYVWDHEPERMRRRLMNWYASPSRSNDLAVADARLLVAKQSGFDSWEELTESISSKPSSRDGSGLKSPSYRVDEERRSIEVHGPMTERDWDEVFAVMKQLHLVELRAGAQVSDASLAHLGRLDHVTTVELSGAQQLTYAGLRHLANLPLHHLALGGWGTTIGDEALQVLASLPELRTLSLTWAQRVTDAGLQHAAGCTHLESANLMGTSTGDGALRTLAGKPRLHALDAGTRVTPAGLVALHDFPVFKNPLPEDVIRHARTADVEPSHVALHPAPFSAGGLESIVGLEGLYSFRLFSIDRSLPPVRGVALQPLLRVASIESLWCDPSDDAMAVIAAMPRVRKLMCQDTAASDPGWVSLGASRTIESIWGRRNSGLTGPGFAGLSQMPSLKSLGVNLARVDGVGLARLPNFPALRELTPIGLGDAAFEHVGKCVDLETLTCMYTDDIGDAATEHLANLLHLRKYYAGDTRIGDRSLELLGSLPALENVELWSCIRVTDAGLAALARAPRLQRVSVETSPLVTRDAAKRFPPQVSVRIA
jgi:hypothetical protein